RLIVSAEFVEFAEAALVAEQRRVALRPRRTVAGIAEERCGEPMLGGRFVGSLRGVGQEPARSSEVALRTQRKRERTVGEGVVGSNRPLLVPLRINGCEIEQPIPRDRSADFRAEVALGRAGRVHPAVLGVNLLVTGFE